MSSTDATGWVLSRLGLANDATTTVEMIADKLGEHGYDVDVRRWSPQNHDGTHRRWQVGVSSGTDSIDWVAIEDGATAMAAMSQCMRQLLWHMQDRDAAEEERDDDAKRADAWCAKADNEQEGG